MGHLSVKNDQKKQLFSDVHSVVTNVRPSEATAVGGLLTGSATKTTAIVDLTKDDGNKNVADSREVSFNKLQGKNITISSSIMLLYWCSFLNICIVEPKQAFFTA